MRCVLSLHESKITLLYLIVGMPYLRYYYSIIGILPSIAHSYFLFYFQYTILFQGMSCNNYYMLYLTFYGSAGGCIHVKVNVGSDKIRCCCDANSIYYFLQQMFKHVYLLQNE